MKANSLNADLATLNSLDVVALSAVWQRHFGGRSPDHLPRSLLVRLIAYRLQVQLHGNLSKRTSCYLRKIETDLKSGRNIDTRYIEQKQLKPGIQLVREHGGVLHRVVVLEGAFAWDGKTYPSLSAVAKAITGTHWNGNRFFGLMGNVRLEADATS